MVQVISPEVFEQFRIIINSPATRQQVRVEHILATHLPSVEPQPPEAREL